MKFKNIDDLRKNKHREKQQSIEVLVGMTTCGIAAGADKVYEALKVAIKEMGMQVDLKKVGCLGLCYSEPNVEIKIPGMPDVLYGKVDEKFARRLIEKHVGDRRIVNENIYDKPFIDILNTK